MAQDPFLEEKPPRMTSGRNGFFDQGKGASFTYQEQTFLWTDQQSDALKRLYQLGVRDQWDPDVAIDWSIEISYGRSLPADVGL